MDLLQPKTARNLGAHKGPVTRVLYSPRGNYVLTVSAEDGTAGVWNTSTWKRLQTLKPGDFEKDAGSIIGAAFSPDEAYLITAQQKGTVHIWETATGRNVEVKKAHDKAVTNVAFSAKGDLIVLSSGDSTATIWTTVLTSDGQGISSLKHISTLEGHKGPVSDATFSPNGEFIVSSGFDGTVRVWEAATGAPVTEFKSPQGRLLTAAFNRDNTSIITRDAYGKAYLFNCEVCHDPGVVKQLAFEQYAKQITRDEVDRLKPKY